MEKTYSVRVHFFIEACPLPPVRDIISVSVPIKYAHCEVDEQNYIGSIIHEIATNYIEEIAENENEKYDARLNCTVSFSKM
jgi:hypothetical protein